MFPIGDGCDWFVGGVKAIVWDDWVDLGAVVQNAAPPSEKPPPPPVSSNPTDSHVEVDIHVVGHHSTRTTSTSTPTTCSTTPTTSTTSTAASHQQVTKTKENKYIFPPFSFFLFSFSLSGPFHILFIFFLLLDQVNYFYFYFFYLGGPEREKNKQIQHGGEQGMGGRAGQGPVNGKLGDFSRRFGHQLISQVKVFPGLIFSPARFFNLIDVV